MQAFKEAAKALLAFLFFVAIALGLAWFEGPALWKDLRISYAGFVEAEGARVVSAFCKPAQVIFSKCDVLLELPGESRSRSFDFLALGGLIGRQQANVVRSATEPSEVTTTLALEHLPRRIAALIGLEAAILAVLFVGIRTRSQERAEKRGGNGSTSPADRAPRGWPEHAASAAVGNTREPVVSRRSGRSWG